MDSKLITVECQCDECGGTGLYSGMAERDTCAVVCYRCNGSGKSSISYRPFTERKRKPKVKRVFRSSFGYGHTDVDYTSKDGITVCFSKGGCTYSEWLNGTKPKPVKDLYCPYLWVGSCVGKEPLPECRKNVGLGDTISHCKLYSNKAKCWEKFEKITPKSKWGY